MRLFDGLKKRAAKAIATARERVFALLQKAAENDGNLPPKEEAELHALLPAADLDIETAERIGDMQRQILLAGKEPRSPESAQLKLDEARKRRAAILERHNQAVARREEELAEADAAIRSAGAELQAAMEAGDNLHQLQQELAELLDPAGFARAEAAQRRADQVTALRKDTQRELALLEQQLKDGTGNTPESPRHPYDGRQSLVDAIEERRARLRQLNGAAADTRDNDGGDDDDDEPEVDGKMETFAVRGGAK